MGYLFGLLAALLFGANGSVTKVVIESGLSPTQVTQFRTLGTFLIAGAILLVVDRSAFRLPLKQIGIMAVLGVFGVALLQVTYAYAVQLLPVGIALLFEYLAVLIVALVAFLFFKEQVRARLWIAIGLVLAGLALVAQVWASHLDPFGVIMALAAALTLSIYFLVGERQVTATSPLAVAFWTGGFAALFWAFFSGWWAIDPAILTHPVSLTGNLAEVVLPLWVPLAWLVVMGSFLPFLLSFSAIGRLKATAAGVLASSEVIFAFAVAWLWLGERLGPVQLVGAAVVLAGIVLAQTARRGRVVDADLALANPDVGGRT
ncbi:DMT family transporter [Leifsonia sp. H3M29-4]|uniref:EamA family transporter n=1 Tax=Salinibacterium metalliresistens TaxID=3031321 RepID=UPI0023DAA67B|nr:DMT family transporter [Salinibacterium metalliresistens]MDF1478585.1 DMT family transporter [Salinibacterium metalliresistens]